MASTWSLPDCVCSRLGPKKGLGLTMANDLNQAFFDAMCEEADFFCTNYFGTMYVDEPIWEFVCDMFCGFAGN